MADLQAQNQGKKKKNKKKPKSSATPSVSTNQASATSTVNKQSVNTTFDMEAVKASLKEVEVTVLPSNINQDNNSTSKKKKKKSQKESSASVPGTSVSVSETNKETKNLLNYSENGIHLANHPEISVTFTSAVENNNKVSEPDKVTSQNVEEKGKETTISKKKKKKMRKNNVSVPSSEPSSEPSSTTAVTSYSTPTYTKVVTSDNTCVLVVNHENFSNGNQTSTAATNSTKASSGNGINTFTFSSEKPLITTFNEKLSSPKPNVALNNSVSIFPVSSTDEKKQSASQQQNLATDSNNLKKDESANEKSEEGKTKAQLKAERRAKQEAQRAAKLAKTGAKSEPTQNVNQNKNINSTKETVLKDNIQNVESVPEQKSVDKEISHKFKLFSHLPQYRQFETNVNMHPAILELGFQYNKGIICGSNARCVALLAALREVIIDFSPKSKFSRDLEAKLQSCLNFLSNLRPLSVSMINSVKLLKHHVNHIPDEMDIDEAKTKLCHFINDFVKEEILLAKEAISNSASAKIVNGDVILIFSHSSLVKDMLCKAHSENKVFRVIVADSRPKLEALSMLQYLVKKGIQCSYISISAVSIVMKEVSKTIIGAHALLSNGCVMSRLGCKSIALVASAYSVPVLVCCETYKFSERVLTDSIVYNELGEPKDLARPNLVQNDSLKNWQDLSSLQLLTFLYDVTTPDLVSMVITEKGVLPCTSVPVVLRVKHAGLHD